MTLAAVHLPASFVVPAGVAAAAVLCWYWWILGAPEVPVSRRRLRRASIVVMIAALPALVRGIAFVDPAVAPRDYVITWLLALGAVLIVVTLALFDLINNMRLHHRSRRDLVDRVLARRADGEPR